MLAFSNSKINLGLYVTEKRTDGFHNIETVFYPIPLNDIVEVLRRSDPSWEKVLFTNTGKQVDCDAEKNLCIKAYHLLDGEFGLPAAEIVLHKAVPMGAGLGGGSANAAYALVLLNKLFGLGLTTEKLAAYAARLGSDCAFFVYNTPMLGTGRGEILSPVGVSLKGYWLVLVKPDIHVGTAEAYKGVKLEKPAKPLTGIMNLPVGEWKHLLKNNFEENIFRNHPGISAIKEKLYGLGAVYASMSGSGSTVFGLFKEAVGLKDNFPGCFYWEGEL